MTRGFQVQMTWAEIIDAACQGVERGILWSAGGMPIAQGRAPGPNFDGHCWGAIGEAAVAKCLCVPWERTMWRKPGDDIPSTDVAGFEVRTVNERRLRLIVQPKDIRKGPNHIVILADASDINQVQAVPVVWVRGWVYAAHCAHDHFKETWRPGGGAFYVPDEFLTPIEKLKVRKQDGAGNPRTEMLAGVV